MLKFNNQDRNFIQNKSVYLISFMLCFLNLILELIEKVISFIKLVKILIIIIKAKIKQADNVEEVIYD